jgi:antitoxin component YwqK of YwqJK toxin-antitoxin module
MTLAEKIIQMKHGLSLLIVLIFSMVFVSCRKTILENYPSGKPKVEQTFKGDKLDGIYRSWYESGVLQQQADYKSDLLEGKMTRWYANGNKEAEEHYSKGLKAGTASYWDTDGNLVEVNNFRNDTLHGEYRYWYPSGVPKIEGFYQEGLYHGKWTYFSEMGIKVGEGEFNRGSGVLIGFDPRGWKNHLVTYKANKKEGEELRYNNKGEVLERSIYKEDKLIESSKVK